MALFLVAVMPLSALTVTGLATTAAVAAAMRQVTKLAIHVTNLGSAYTFYGALGNGPNVSPRIKGATLRLQLSSDNEHWSNAWAAATSTSAGEYMFHLTLTAGRTYYFRTYYACTTELLQVFSRTAEVTMPKKARSLEIYGLLHDSSSHVYYSTTGHPAVVFARLNTQMEAFRLRAAVFPPKM